MKTSEELWSDYSTKVYPGGFSEHQAAENRQSFFAGALMTMQQIMKEAVISPSERSLDNLNEFYEGVQRELLDTVKTEVATQ